MNDLEENKRFLTDFDGKFKARLSSVSPISASMIEGGGTYSPYECRVKAEYNRDLLRLLDDGMLLAIRNFRTKKERETRYTLVEVVRFWPEHFGLRGLRDYQYYPIQFEVIERSVDDWETNDKSTMIIQLSTIPINYDLIMKPGVDLLFEKGFSYPVIGDKAWILSKETIGEIYNRGVLEKIGFSGEETSDDPWRDPRIGAVKMFEAIGEDIPIYVDFDSLVRYHFGVFAFTGGGKSNLVSNILRRLLIHTQDTKIIIFDISCEYPFLLADIFAHPSIPSKIILESKVRNAEEFYNSVVKPKRYENDERVQKALNLVLKEERVSYLKKIGVTPPRFSEIFESLANLKASNIKNPNYVEALEEVEWLTSRYIESHGLSEDDGIDIAFVQELTDTIPDLLETYKIHPMSALYGWFESRNKLMRYFPECGEEEKRGQGYTLEMLEKLVDDKARLVCISISDPTTIKQLVIDFTQDMLRKRKREFKVKPYILFVFDEAQEFVASPSESSGVDRRCSQAVERLLRQGRKYGLGGCIATQRIAHLNTNALQQLHTYFVSTLPRVYDRGVVSETFMIDRGILDRTLEFAPGDWLLSSYIATGMESIPIFIRADNAEEHIERFLQSI